MTESAKLVVAALAAGAAVDAGETTSTAVKDEYSKLRTLALRALRRAEQVPSGVVEAVETDAIKPLNDDSSVAQRRELTTALATAEANDELMAAALKFLELTDPAGTQPGEHQVLLYGNKGLQLGNNNTQNNFIAKAQLPAIETISALPNLSRIPAETAMFVGRSDELRKLEQTLNGSGRAAVVAIHGLGGVGKSTLAAQFAHLNADKFGFRWWIAADSPAAIETGLADLAVALAPDTAELPAAQRSDLAIRWLATHDGWLLVLDNVVSPNHPVMLLERVRTGTVLMTSRQATGWHAIAATVNLNVLAVDNAVELVTKILRVHNPEACVEGAAELCRELGYLPLAIEQASAYMAETSINPLEYLDLLARYPATMYGETSEGSDAQRTMARIWHVTLDHLTDTPLAGQVLRVLAWYAPDDIPTTLLTGLAEEPLLRKAIGRLAAYSMITHDQGMISMHRLVQAVTRTPDPQDPHRIPEYVDQALENATRALAQHLYPLDYDAAGDWPAFRSVLPHVRALTNHADAAADTHNTVIILRRVSAFLLVHRQVTDAANYLRRCHISTRTLYGPDHPATLTSQHNLACAYQEAGNLEQAIPLLEAVSADSLLLLGPDHSLPLAYHNNLARAYESAGDLGRAIPLFEEVLTDRERVLGNDHPDTLASRNNLASAYGKAGDPRRAIPLLEAVSADSLRLLGPNHLITPTSRNNLAFAYESAGDLERAIQLYEEILADRERSLGNDHPHTLSSRNNLAGAYESAGDLERAIQLYEEVLTDREQVLGPNHPDTLTSRNNLAYAYGEGGDLPQAISLLEALSADSRRVLGPHHPNTLAYLNNLADVYSSAGELGRAISLYKEVVIDRVRVLGADHADTLLSRHNLATVYQNAGNSWHAVSLYEAILTDAESSLGTDHPTTNVIRSNLHRSRQQTSKTTPPPTA